MKVSLNIQHPEPADLRSDEKTYFRFFIGCQHFCLPAAQHGIAPDE